MIATDEVLRTFGIERIEALLERPTLTPADVRLVYPQGVEPPVAGVAETWTRVTVQRAYVRPEAVYEALHAGVSVAVRRVQHADAAVLALTRAVAGEVGHRVDAEAWILRGPVPLAGESVVVALGPGVASGGAPLPPGGCRRGRGQSLEPTGPFGLALALRLCPTTRRQVAQAALTELLIGLRTETQQFRPWLAQAPEAEVAAFRERLRSVSRRALDRERRRDAAASLPLPPNLLVDMQRAHHLTSADEVAASPLLELSPAPGGGGRCRVGPRAFDASPELFACLTELARGPRRVADLPLGSSVRLPTAATLLRVGALVCHHR
ncbi:MAG: hypothetical protein R3F59_12725 [Myxococcota bacterium]